MNKLYGKIKMSWGRVILFALIAGIYTGLIMLVPFLKETSFQDIGIGYEWWVVFAVILVVNCEKSWDAALKCFVFFLISQPLVYAVEIIFGDLTLYMGWYYYRTIWLPATLLTLPGGFIAYFCKKQNMLGAFILGLGNTILGLMGLTYFAMAYQSFPYHLLSGLFSVAAIFVQSIFIQKDWRKCFVAILIPVVLVMTFAIYIKSNGLSLI